VSRQQRSGQSGAAQSGAVQSGAAQPGTAQPGAGEHGASQSGTGPSARAGVQRSALGRSAQSSAGAAATRLPQAVPPPTLTLDALGKKCPIPIIMLADRIREVRVGQTIAVLADDPAAKTDLPAWCALKSQEFIRADDLPVGWSFLVRRTY